MSAIGSAIPDCLKMTVCPNCGYSLWGHPDTGTCPECGRAFDQTEIVVYGWPRGQRQNLANAGPQQFIWVLIPEILWVGCVVWIFVGMTRRSLDIVFVLIIAQLAVRRFWPLLQRQRLAFPGRTQIRMNERGCVQYDTLPEPIFLQELHRTYGWLFPVTVAVAVYLGCRYHDIPDPIGWIACPILLIVGLAYGLEARRFRRRLAKIADGAIADRNAAYHVATPWRKIRHFELTPLEMRPEKDQTYSLQIGNEKSGSGKASVVDADILCTPQQASELGLWLDQRVPLARAAEAAGG